MSDFWHILFIFLHLLGVAVFLGPQVFLAFAWVPASRGIEDMPTRIKTMRTVTRRFAWIGGAALVVIVIAGSYLIANWREYWGLDNEVDFTDYRGGIVFIVKMTLFVVMLAVVALHTFIIGPRLIDAMERQAAADATVARLRRQSMTLSIAGLVLTLAIVLLGTMLATIGWSGRLA